MVNTRLVWLLCGCWLLGSSPSDGQTLGYGGRLGLSIGELTPDDGVETRTKGGYVAGGFLDFRFTDTLSVQPQVLFVQKGAKTLEDDIDGTITLDYLEIPILGMLRLPQIGPAIPFVYAGPALGLNVNATIEVDGFESDIPEEQVKSNDVAVAFGGGILVDGFSVEARYTVGVSSIAEAAEAPKTRALYILGGFNFPLP